MPNRSDVQANDDRSSIASRFRRSAHLLAVCVVVTRIQAATRLLATAEDCAREGLLDERLGVDIRVLGTEEKRLEEPVGAHRFHEGVGGKGLRNNPEQVRVCLRGSLCVWGCENVQNKQAQACGHHDPSAFQS